MVSIIFSTIQEDTSVFEKNIKETIGVEYETIKMLNKAQYSLTEAYNKGAKEAKFEYLCFIHDDILFSTKNWGKRMVENFQNPDLKAALIGVIGSEYKSVFPTPWTCPLVEYNKGGVTQYFKHKTKEMDSISYSKGNGLTEVVVVDGMFLFSTKSAMQQVGFFDENLIGFHCYDIDLSLSFYNQQKKIYVDESLSLEHHSEGKLNNDWFENQLYLMKKWKDLLPANIIGKGIIHYEIEVGSLKRSLYLFLKNKVRFTTRCKYLAFYITFNKIPIFKYLSLYKRIVANYFHAISFIL